MLFTPESLGQNILTSHLIIITRWLYYRTSNVLNLLKHTRMNPTPRIKRQQYQNIDIYLTLNNDNQIKSIGTGHHECQRVKFGKIIFRKK